MSEPVNNEETLSNSEDWNLPDISAPTLHDTGGIVDLRQNAWREGKIERPASDATKSNPDEELIIGHYRKQHSQLRDSVKARLKIIQEQFNRALQPPSMSELRNSIQEARIYVTTDLAQSKQALEERRRILIMAERNRAEFKLANNLHREARYPQSKMYHFAIILVLVIMECIANMYFFAQGNELGLLGGILQAALISVANVGTAILAGYFLVRSTTHTKRSIKIPAIGMVVIYTSAIIAFNLLASHYRDMMSVPGEALGGAIPHMMSNPLGLSFHSVLLFVTGLCASALGVYKGMSVDDTYLGYGDVDRDYKEAVVRYSEYHEEVQSKVLHRMDALRAKSEALRKNVATKREIMQKCIDNLTSLRDVHFDRVNRITGECRRLLKSYRADNELIRVSPAPAYFREFPTFGPDDGSSDLLLPEVADWHNEIEKAEPKMCEVEKFTDQTDEGHEELVNDAIRQFEATISAIKESLSKELLAAVITSEPILSDEKKELEGEA